MDRNIIYAFVAILVVGIAAIVAAVTAFLPASESGPQDVSGPVEPTEYSDGVYEGVLTGSELTIESAELGSCGSGDVVIIGEGWPASADRSEAEIEELRLLESGVTVASTDTTLFDRVDGVHAFI